MNVAGILAAGPGGALYFDCPPMTLQRLYFSLFKE
jgi:hypothetical protein